MRRMAALSLLLLPSAAACSRCQSAPPPATSVTIGPPPAAVDAASPPPLVFADEGDAGRLTLPNGIVLSLRPVGPSLISVSITEASPPTWATIELERRVAGQELVQVETFTRLQKGYRPYNGRSHHLAAPGTTYAYRARLGPKGEWTSPVDVRTGAPKLPPPPPTNVRAVARDRHSIEIAWDADVRAVNGIEIDVKRDDEWIAAAIVEVESKTFVHNLLLPKSTHEYRVGTFNEHGKSAFVETGATTTTTTIAKPENARTTAGPLRPCTKLPPEKDPAFDLARVELTASGGPRLISDPKGGGARQLFGEYKGCLRDLGTFGLQGDVFTALDWTDDGFPLLRGIEGAGEYVGAQVGLFAFSNGSYERVNEAMFCGEPRDDDDPKDPRVPQVGDRRDVTGWRGPFEVCQLDFPR